MSHLTWPLGPVLCALSLASGCGGERDPAAPPAAAPATSAAAATAAAPEARPAPGGDLRVLAWLDPDAPAVAYMRTPADLEPEALGELFALPPRALTLLRSPLSFEAGLAALTSPAAPAPETWLARDLVVMQPPLAHGPYLVRRLLAPRADVEGWLRAGGMTSEIVEGLALWTPGPEVPEPATAAGLPNTLAPAAVFPWRVVFLADDLIGAYSLGEIGHGLGPLTAARDLPPSDLTRTVTEVVTRDPDLLVEIYAQGVMLHFDLSDDLGVAKLSLRRGPGGGLDGEVILQPLGDLAAAAAALDKRAPAGAATDVLRELYDRVAFSVDGPIVRGRLQLAAEDLAPLRRGGGA